MGPAPLALDMLISAPVVAVGVNSSDVRFDVLASNFDDARLVAAAVHANPHASVTLVQLLRLGQELSARQALVAESLAYATLQGGPEFKAWLSTQGQRVRPRGDNSPAHRRSERRHTQHHPKPAASPQPLQRRHARRSGRCTYRGAG